MIKEYKYYLFVILFFMLSESGNLYATDDHEHIKNIVLKLFNEIEKGNYIYSVQNMYPPIADAAGGKEELIEYAREIMNSRTVKSATYEVTIVEPLIATSGKYRDYIIVPLIMIMESDGIKIKSSGFQMAVRDINSERWWLADGEGLNKEVMNYFFPDFPSTIKLPELKKERL